MTPMVSWFLVHILVQLYLYLFRNNNSTNPLHLKALLYRYHIYYLYFDNIMLVSFSIFHKGGLMLYQHAPDIDPTEDDPTNSGNTTADAINTWLSQVYLNPTKSLTDRKAVIDADTTNDRHNHNHNHSSKQVVEWQEEADWIAVAVYPDLRRGEDNPWIAALLKTALQEFQVFWTAQQQQQQENDNDNPHHSLLLPQPINDMTLFDKTFQLLFKKYKSSDISTLTGNSANNSKGNSNSNNKSHKTKGKGGKEKRQWHDGKAKVTKEAMAELDFSKTTGDEDNEEAQQDKDAVALAEARAAYLPTDADLAEFELVPEDTLDDEDDDEESSWGDSLKGLFQQATGQKVLSKQDLQEPLKEMHRTLTSKNVASDIAQQICDNVESSLVGKKLSSMYRVKTAVRQALEKAINKLLLPSTQLDMLRQVVSKRDAMFGKRKPFVIVVVGINGVGKSTSLAKLAFYLKSNGCKPLLAACDTFRSGAVEQLSVHAKCLDLPIFHQGYSKDPSSVAKAAIEQASKMGNDVVLVDTAGRMQNNVPLMKALGKLADENQPDLVVFVGEALVGNDGVDQVRMFNQAVSSISRTQKINALLMTKFDTVSDKVGAALTMTHVTNAPILFVGTGQKYHHLQKLSTQSVIRSLFK
jgi:signal recognition particle receptor subunit alpha